MNYTMAIIINNQQEILLNFAWLWLKLGLVAIFLVFFRKDWNELKKELMPTEGIASRIVFLIGLYVILPVSIPFSFVHLFKWKR